MQNSFKKRAILYDIILPHTTREEAAKRIAETRNLLDTYGGVIELCVIQRRHHASSTSFIGLEKLKEISDEGKKINANLLIVNDNLKSKQIYGIEKFFEEINYKIEVWDRVDLIIQIFTQHASSGEAKLQLELAKLNHLGPRIYGMGEDLSQQGGGIGTRGLGETNTEIMKRHIAQRKKLIKVKIKKLQRNREMTRKYRLKKGFLSVSIIGYTNAGKSSLFRALTKRDVKVKDELFVTLDTTTARLYLNNVKKTILLSDTIGFINKLPPQLLDAFRSTLEETLHAHLLLHVVDLCDPEYQLKIKEVNSILHSLDCQDIPVIKIYNKIDLVDSSVLKERLDDEILVSAQDGFGLKSLKLKLEETLFPEIMKDLEDGNDGHYQVPDYQTF